ncbi:MAG TPA: hypothetical protein VGQ06_12555 [Gemmatimonadales bacterium]|jgi:hypothetical protein|nr:hypothetical protein [Gemmatimonadales bacterium]
MRLRRGRLLLFCAALLASSESCSKNPVSPVAPRIPVFGPVDSVFTDEQLHQAAYTPYTGPAGIYSEPPVPYAAPLYVSSYELSPGAGTYIEFSTEDTAQARAWAVAAAWWCTVDPKPPTLNWRYIEFATYSPGEGPRMPVRTHRTSYLDRSGYDRFHPTSLYGVLQVRPIDNAEARGLAEYLWFKEHRYSNYKVLSSFSRPSQGSILHTIFYIHRAVGIGLFGPYEYVELFRNDFRVDTTSGAIMFHETHLRDVPS